MCICINNKKKRANEINKENYIMKKKDIKREHGRNRYHNMSKETKQRLKNNKKIIAKQKIQQKKILSFFFIWYKNEKKSFGF